METDPGSANEPATESHSLLPKEVSIRDPSPALADFLASFPDRAFPAGCDGCLDGCVAVLACPVGPGCRGGWAVVTAFPAGCLVG